MCELCRRIWRLVYCGFAAALVRDVISLRKSVAAMSGRGGLAVMSNIAVTGPFISPITNEQVGGDPA